MTKYQELCSIFTKARNKYFDNRRACLNFTTNFIGGLTNFLQCPEEQVKIFPFEGEREPGFTYTIAGEMKLDNNSFWHLRIGIELHQDSDILPYDIITFPIFIKKPNDHFILKLGSEGERFEIHDNDEDEFKSVFEQIFKKIKDIYEQDIQKFNEQKNTVKKMGFIP